MHIWVSADTIVRSVLCMSVNTHHKPWEVSSALHAEGTDEEVEDCSDEDYDACYIVEVVQTLLQGGVIQVTTTCVTHVRTVEKERVQITLGSVLLVALHFTIN